MKQAPLPPRDVRKFTGDPLDYYRFITDFNDNIASRVKDPMTNLTYLISPLYWQGVRCCSIYHHFAPT